MKTLAITTALIAASAFMATSAHAYKIYRTYNYSPPSQVVVAEGACNDGTSFKVRVAGSNSSSSRYAIYNTYASSANGVIAKFCRNHGG